MKTIVCIILLTISYKTANAASEMPDSTHVWRDITLQVAEGVAIVEAMNWLYDNQKKIWAPVKGLERYEAIKVLKGVGMATWDYYMVWKKLMDKIAGFVDNMEEAKRMFEEAEKTAEGIYDYYSEFDFKKLKLTNLTSLICMNRFYMLDFYLNGGIYYGVDAFKQLGFCSYIVQDVIENPVRINRIAACEKGMAKVYAYVANENAIYDGNLSDPTQPSIAGQLESIAKNTVSGNNELHSGQNYHVAATLASIAYQASHLRVRTVTAGMLNTMLLLDCVSSEAKDWEKERSFILSFSDGENTGEKMWNNPSPAPFVFNRDLDLKWYEDNYHP